MLGAGLVLYLSWLPWPQLRTTGLLPAWLAAWSDQAANENIRTAVPFLGLGLLTGGWLLDRGRWSWRGGLGAWAVLTALAGVAEAGQLLLPHRSCDPADVLWGAGGALAGLLLLAGLAWLLRLRI
ncbi:hypothetical protein CDA63_16720 [Hymenobacter amundsenii]|uniref:VanZ-like domain-containing protein n=1 Tax=Hymenobacter amundsenii TaxID=2006685 RepID=A0A246FHD9_9BACT|nr:hypothetical protein CDA63_16720 [Hymenobacter amundsenii]